MESSAGKQLSSRYNHVCVALKSVECFCSEN